MMKCTCVECGITKTKFISPIYGQGVVDSLAETALDATLKHGIPYLAKKGTEAGRYYLSQAMRNPKLQKKAINYVLKKTTPVIQKTGSEYKS